MQDVIRKTFGGLDLQFYLRQLLFSGVALLFLYHWTSVFTPPVPIWIHLWAGASLFLYPYSRFVYISVVNYIVGDNLFIFPTLVMLIAKVWTMIGCFFFAFIIAPIGLAWLYWHHSRQEQLYES